MKLLSNNKKLPQNRIAELRKKKKLSQAQLAKETGLTRQAISLYEIGKREPKLETWLKLADFFDVPVSYLQGLSDHNYNDRKASTRTFLEKHPDFAPLPDGVSIDDVDFSKSLEIMDISDLDNQMRDSTLRQFQKLTSLFLSKSNSQNWTEISEKQRKRFTNISSSLSDQDVSEIVHYVSMSFYMLLSDGNDKKKLKRIIDDFYDKYISDNGDGTSFL